MEVVKYLCEFFFGNFWHWLGLIFLLGEICSISFVRIIKDKDDDKGKA